MEVICCRLCDTQVNLCLVAGSCFARLLHLSESNVDNFGARNQERFAYLLRTCELHHTGYASGPYDDTVYSSPSSESPLSHMKSVSKSGKGGMGAKSDKLGAAKKNPSVDQHDSVQETADAGKLGWKVNIMAEWCLSGL